MGVDYGVLLPTYHHHLSERAFRSAQKRTENPSRAGHCEKGSPLFRLFFFSPTFPSPPSLLFSSSPLPSLFLSSWSSLHSVFWIFIGLVRERSSVCFLASFIPPSKNTPNPASRAYLRKKNPSRWLSKLTWIIEVIL